MADLQLGSNDYRKWHSIIPTVVEFFKDVLTPLGWDKGDQEEFIMDVGCGPGVTTKDLILPYFNNVKRLVAIDAIGEMITIAYKDNEHQLIEYNTVDITDWACLRKWNQKITKCISIHCFHWIRDQRCAFQNIYHLLKPGGEAALFFVLEASFFDTLLHLQRSEDWSAYLTNRDNNIPASHHYKYDESHYKQLVESIGFEVRHCKKAEKIDVYSSDEKFKNFFASICVFMPFIPEERKEEFKDAILNKVIELNGRSPDGRPQHKGQILELVIKKN